MRKSKYIDLKTREGRQSFYQTKEWQTIRLIVLTNNPYCEQCLLTGIKTIATEVDHIIDIKDEPTMCVDINNLQGLCKSCHSIKTIQANMPQVHVKFISAHKKWNFV